VSKLAAQSKLAALHYIKSVVISTDKCSNKPLYGPISFHRTSGMAVFLAMVDTAKANVWVLQHTVVWYSTWSQSTTCHNHLGAMCSRAWRSQWPRIASSLGPGMSAY